MRRGLCLAVALLVGAVVATPVAGAATRTAIDRENGLRFHLDGKVLTISLAPQSGREPADVRQELWGERVSAACSTSYQARPGRRSAVHVTRLWPEGAHHVAFFFGRDISRRAKWCILEEPGGADIGVGALQPPPGRLLVQTKLEADPSAPGPRAFIRLRDSRGRLVIERRARVVDRWLRPGRYTLTSSERDPPAGLSCSRQIRIRPVGGLALLALVVTVDPGRGCRIETVAEARPPGG